MNPEQNITLTLTAAQVQSVLQALAHLPWAQVDSLLRSIQTQADAQLNAKPVQAAQVSTKSAGGPGPRTPIKQ